MRDEDVIELFRHYRHDLMNHLQVIDGYASMGKTDKMQLKLNDYLTDLQEEGKLVHLNAPVFSLYILQLAMLHTRFHVTYRIGIKDADLREVDQLLAERSQKVIAEIERMTDHMEAYDLAVDLDYASDGLIELTFIVSGHLSNTPIQTLEDSRNYMTVCQQKNSLKCMVTIPHEGGI